jgi:nucleotide-binding universal stress UspA family protein
MLVIRRILFPVDFSGPSYAVAPFAQAMARRFHAQLVVLRVAPMLGAAWFDQSSEPPFIDAEALAHDLEPRLDEAFRKEFADLEVERVMELGEAAEVIARFSNTESVDLIMMPTRGDGPPRRLLIGSVTAKVLHDAQCPVWTRAHNENPLAAQASREQTVLCAIDTTPASTSVMHWALEFALKLGAALKLVYVMPDTEDWSPSVKDLTELRAAMRGKIESLQRQGGVSAPSSIVIGKVGPEVCGHAKTLKADFIVVGRGRLHDTPGRLGKHAYDIIRHAPCPVISI